MKFYNRYTTHDGLKSEPEPASEKPSAQVHRAFVEDIFSHPNDGIRTRRYMLMNKSLSKDGDTIWEYKEDTL